jgi:argininosuccinate lyase
MQSIEPLITDDVFNVLSVDKSVASRVSFGGTAPTEVLKQVEIARKRIG